MMRVPPCDDPRACGSVNCSRPSTRRPRLASSASVAAPIAPSPTTMASQVTLRRYADIELAVECPYTAPTGRRASDDSHEHTTELATTAAILATTSAAAARARRRPAALRRDADPEEIDVADCHRGDRDRRRVRRHHGPRHHRGYRHPRPAAGAYDRQRGLGDLDDASDVERAVGVASLPRRTARPALLPRRSGQLRRHAVDAVPRCPDGVAGGAQRL